MIIAYAKEIEEWMSEFHSRLPEKNRRLYAGLEALKLTFGGITYIAKLFNCSRNTVQLGIQELLAEETLDQNRSRRNGGGRKAVLEKQPDINEVFLLLLKERLPT